MPTKKELEAEVESLKRSNAALKGQITKLSDSGALDEPVRELLELIEAKGLASQINETGEIRRVYEALDS